MAPGLPQPAGSCSRRQNWALERMAEVVARSRGSSRQRRAVQPMWVAWDASCCVLPRRGVWARSSQVASLRAAVSWPLLSVTTFLQGERAWGVGPRAELGPAHWWRRLLRVPWTARRSNQSILLNCLAGTIRCIWVRWGRTAGLWGSPGSRHFGARPWVKPVGGIQRANIGSLCLRLAGPEGAVGSEASPHCPLQCRGASPLEGGEWRESGAQGCWERRPGWGTPGWGCSHHLQ